MHALLLVRAIFVRMPRPAALLALLVAAAVALSGCSDSKDTAAAAGTPPPSPTSAAASASPVSTPATCPNGRLANGDCAGGTVAANPLAGDPVAPLVCPKILKVQGTDAIYNDASAMKAIGEQAATSLAGDLAFKGKMLVERAKLAAAAKGHSDELTMSLGMGTAATDLATACTKAGFK